MNKLKNISQYIPFVFIVLGIIAIVICAFQLATQVGWLAIGIGLFGLAYILAPKGGQS